MTENLHAKLEERREEIRKSMIETMRLLDGSLASSVSLLTGLSREQIEGLGGTGDWEDYPDEEGA